MDGALERIARARTRIEDGEHADQDGSLSAAAVLVGELRDGLDVQRGGPLAVHFDDLYGYLSRQLASAGHHNRIETLNEVSDLLREVRTAWVTLPDSAYV